MFHQIAIMLWTIVKENHVHEIPSLIDKSIFMNDKALPPQIPHASQAKTFQKIN